VNAALSRLGNGFALWIDALRLPSVTYPEPSVSHFPDSVSWGIDEERRRHFLEQGAHFESEQALLVQYTPPVRRKSRMADFVYGDVLPSRKTIRNMAAKPRPPLETRISEVSSAFCPISKTAFAIV
jgi:type IV secretory pathway VirB4 component